MFDLFGWGRRHVHPGWPESTPTVILPAGDTLRLRPLLKKDAKPWCEMRLRDKQFLYPVEPTPWESWEESHSASGWGSTYSFLRQQARAGTVVPFAVECNARFVGQLTIGNIQHGRVSEAWIGYWIFSSFTGRGIASAACALGVDHAFGRIGLHRLTATFLPDNPASGAVLRASGFRTEGYFRRNLHIAGAWRDHHFVALNRDDYPDTCVERLMRSGKIIELA